MATTEEIIKERHSVKDFLDKPIEGETLEILQKEIADCNEESGLNMELVLNEENAFGSFFLNNFENCKNYIVIMGKKEDKILQEKAGYYGERVVLKAQEIGLNTCWVALTYNKKEVHVNIKEDEKIVILIAIGYGANKGMEHDIKSFSDVVKNSYSVIPGWFDKGVEYALYAPTAMNQQKFKFELKSSKEGSLKISGIGAYTKVDLGIVKYHFELGAGKENFSWVD